jgi:tetratricopeptide (TPR) repeat protein
MASDLPGAGLAYEQALALVRGVASAPMGPLGRQVWLEILLRALMGKAELLRRTGSLDEAQLQVDEAAARLPEFDDPEGIRTAELGLARVHLLMDRSEFGAAEELASAMLATTPATVVPTVPRLMDCLGVICASTRRFDLAEDWFVRAEDGFRGMGDTDERQRLIAHRAYAAMRRGELGLAERLYAEASAVFERRGLSEDLAVCEQARGFLAAQRGDPAGASDLVASGLARFERLGSAIAAADTMLLAAQHAYDRGDIPELARLAQGAREVYQERGVYERCAQVDLMLARTLEDNPASVHSALALALPAALALEAARYDFTTAHARSQWLELADDAMRLAFRLAVRRHDQGLLFELVEHRCAGASLVLGRTERTGTGAVFPDAAMKTYAPADGPMTLGGVAAEAAASVGLRVAPPPRVLMSPETGRIALQQYVEAAEFRYHRRIVSEEEVPFSSPPAADELTDRPVVQVRLADAGDLFMAWTWTRGAQGFGTGQAPSDEVDGAVRALAAALPGAGEGAQGMRRAFETGAMSDHTAEQRLARLLAEALWPDGLTAQIREVSAAGGRPLVRIQPSPGVAQVPWELLAVDDDGTRLIDLADVVTTAPASLRRPGPATRPAPDADAGADAVVLVLDPRVPGFRADSPLGSVLGPPGSDPALLSFVQSRLDAGGVVPPVATAAEALRRTDLDRDWLGEALRKGARRLLYVGHVSGAPVEGGQSEDVTLHLCCGPGTEGLTDMVRAHRPLSAKDLLLGTLPLRADGVPGAGLWPAPARVALIACESGGDLRFAESFGLASAMIHNGAELVTATRWVLPTSFAFHRLGGLPESVRPLTEAVVAVDAAHEDEDPVRRLGVWQRERLDRWRTGGRIEDSPLLWAAMTCVVV